MIALSTAQAHWGMRSPLPSEGNYAVPPSKEELDNELRDYLARQRASERDGFTMRALHDTLKALDGRYVDHEKKDDHRHSEAMQAIYGMQARQTGLEAEMRAVKSDIDQLKPAVRDTADSLHDITEHDLKEQLAEKKREKNELAERVWKYVMGVILGITLVVIGAILAKFGLK